MNLPATILPVAENIITTAGFPLTDDQQNAYDSIVNFLLDPHETVFVLKGYSGTGKSTLVETLMDRLPSIEKMMRLVDPGFKGWETKLTATTNKAAEALSGISHMEVVTIQSLLGLRVSTDYKTGKTSLFAPQGGKEQFDLLIYIDEASFIDYELKRFILKLCKRCKIIFMGDPAQLLSVGCDTAPVFASGFKGAHLSEVVRQADGNPIKDLATGFRLAVQSGEFPQCKPDGYYIQWLPRDQFYQAMKKDFTDPTWKFSTSKFLAWTNKCVIFHNHMVREWVKGTPDFEVGDYAVVNSFMASKTYSLKTDQMVHITGKIVDQELGVDGFTYQLDNVRNVFMPRNPDDKQRAIIEARNSDDINTLRTIDEEWADLRAVFACTINKSQGSTYGKVFIDLDDIAKCRSRDQLARMLYVGISRASQQVIFTGDLI